MSKEQSKMAVISLPEIEKSDSKKRKEKKQDKKKKDKKKKSRKKDKVDIQDDDENDDGVLLAAAALWARDEAGETSDKNFDDQSLRKQGLQNNYSVSSSRVFSLHITQLPYDCTEFDLRKLFAEHGCSQIQSIRLVYDYDARGQKTVFRGVAFVDLLDSKSFEAALKLNHKTSIRGRKLNIRPCRSKEELAEIVTRTKELVQEKIRQQRSSERAERDRKVAAGDELSASENYRKVKPDHEKTDSKSRKIQPSSKSVSEDNCKASIVDNESPSKTNLKRKSDTHREGRIKKQTKVDSDRKPIKLTKKERNRRAAIIMRLKRKR